MAYVDVSNFKKGRYELPLKLELPPNVSLVSEQPVITVTLGEDLAGPLLAPTAGAVEPDLGLLE